MPRTNGELTEDECAESRPASRPTSQSNDWAWDVMLSDQIDEIAGSRCRVTGTEEENPSKEGRRQAKTLLEEMTEWKPKFERAIELAAAEVYSALRKGRLTGSGVRLPDPNDVAVSIKLMAEQNKKQANSTSLWRFQPLLVAPKHLLGN